MHECTTGTGASRVKMTMITSAESDSNIVKTLIDSQVTQRYVAPPNPAFPKPPLKLHQSHLQKPIELK
jgi:hypothetical protein